MQSLTLRVIADGNNELGDTLTRLATDLFGTLGYDDCRINIHKTGRELDIKGRHAFEDRLVIAECKAQKQPVGGSDINKFVGVLDAERRTAGDMQVHGYFVSVSGYKESAREQEAELGGKRVTLLDGSDIVGRISASNIVVSVAEATEAAGRRLGKEYPAHKLDAVELLATPEGWLWAIYFLNTSRERYVCVVHADGHVMSGFDHSPIFDEGTIVLDAPSNSSERYYEAASTYREYLASEYGAITLDGLPVDQEVGSKRFRLEDLYVPLDLQASSTSDDLQGGEDLQGHAGGRPTLDSPPVRRSIGDLLTREDRISVLGAPGSGKSTLIKRLAVAYADRERKAESKDGLPDKDWFPLVIQCRHLDTSANQPIHRILQDSFLRTERADLMPDFAQFLGEKLRSGSLLLLVDGLDEIRTAGMRAAFVSQLRTFIARYPAIGLVITSREVGFRYIANSISTICTPYRVSDMSINNISLLVHRWQRHIGGSSREAELEAEKLARAITQIDRVRRLAVNPMLLTTLLLVRRWVGQLPRKRTILYQKAIEVLLMTWNVEGYEPIELDEALPQLGYAAYQMMKTGKSSISAGELTKYFQDARENLPELLAYSKLSASSFLGRVEERSSLLVLSGHALVNGEIVPVYEFKHLTFQEYLAAVALVNRWLSRQDQDRPLYEILSPFLEKDDWTEVVTMAAVLSGREAGKIIERLIDLADAYEYIEKDMNEDDGYPLERSVALSNLISCLGDEVPLAPDVARRALTTSLVSDPVADEDGDLCEACVGGRYYPLLLEVIFEGVHNESAFEAFGNAVTRIGELSSYDMPDATAVVDSIATRIRSKDFNDRIMGAGLLMTAAYYSDQFPSEEEDPTAFPVPGLSALQASLNYVAKDIIAAKDELSLAWMQTWAIAWGGPALTRSADRITVLRTIFFERWMERSNDDLSYKSGWALGRLPLVGSCRSNKSPQEIRKFLDIEVKQEMSHLAQSAMVAGWYLGTWEPEILADMAIRLHERESDRSASRINENSRVFTISLLKILGVIGKSRLNHPSLRMPAALSNFLSAAAVVFARRWPRGQARAFRIPGCRVNCWPAIRSRNACTSLSRRKRSSSSIFAGWPAPIRHSLMSSGRPHDLVPISIPTQAAGEPDSVHGDYPQVRRPRVRQLRRWMSAGLKPG
jgi:hypothetical protein